MFAVLIIFVALDHRRKFIRVKNKLIKYSRDLIWATYGSVCIQSPRSNHSYLRYLTIRNSNSLFECHILMLECLILSLTVTSLLVQQQLSFEDTRAKNVDLITECRRRKGQFCSSCFLFFRWHGKSCYSNHR